MKLEKIFAGVFVFILIFYGISFIIVGSIDRRLLNLPCPALVGLHVESENDPIWERFPGNGTEENPKIIENFVLLEKIERHVFFAWPDTIYEPIVIRNITFHLLIRNCWIITHLVCGGGFYLKASNCRIENCTFQYGHLQISRGVVLNNTFYSPYVEFENCNISNNIFIIMGGHVMFSRGSSVYGNNFIIGDKWKIDGIICLGTNYLNGSGIGNYWSCWSQPDANKDGIVDVPYKTFYSENISGISEGIDCYPSVNPFPLKQKEFLSNVYVEYSYHEQITMVGAGIILIITGAVVGVGSRMLLYNKKRAP
ncbi:MAG: hypothetical protein ACP5LE_04140 [Thermoplasmata archaeon]